MAWDNGIFGEHEVIIGDKPMDEMSVCLRKIAMEYEERYSRLPSVAEYMYTFRVILLSSTSNIVLDPEHLEKVNIELISENK